MSNFKDLVKARTERDPEFKAALLQEARNIVAQRCRENADAARIECPYASHVSEKEKDEIQAEGHAFADRIQSGEETSFTALQLIHHELTGETIALFPQY